MLQCVCVLLVRVKRNNMFDFTPRLVLIIPNTNRGILFIPLPHNKLHYLSNLSLSVISLFTDLISLYILRVGS